jgi:SRSO17 transposase
MSQTPSWAVLTRLTAWLEPFQPCFGHPAQRQSLRAYLDGLLGDSGRKSMQAMLARVTEPRSYQAFQHFITHAPWAPGAVWRQLLTVVPDRRGVLILDDTPFLKRGGHSVGVGRQYATTQKQVVNCQVAVTAALWTGVRGWLVGAELYLPKEWLTSARRLKAHIPRAVRFQEKWRLALTLVARVRAAGIEIAVVVADGGYGCTAALRTALDRWALPYMLGTACDATVFLGRPLVRAPQRTGRPGHPETRPQVARGTRVWTTAALIAAQPRRLWRRVSWANGAQPRHTALFLAVRVTPVVDWRRTRTVREIWLIAERPIGAATPSHYFFSSLPATTSLVRLARVIHHRWAIEQQYQDLKTEMGIDDFEGRTYPGWHHHVVLTAVAYGFLQAERRRRSRGAPLTLPQVRALVQEIFTGLLFITRDRYWNWLQQGRELLPLRI